MRRDRRGVLVGLRIDLRQVSAGVFGVAAQPSLAGMRMPEFRWEG